MRQPDKVKAPAMLEHCKGGELRYNHNPRQVNYIIASRKSQ